jgi:hypothetical protein
MMEAESTSEMSVNLYQSTRRYNPEDRLLRIRHRENLKSPKCGASAPLESSYVYLCLSVTKQVGLFRSVRATTLFEDFSTFISLDAVIQIAVIVTEVLFVPLPL